jgi:hypothetical protein
VTQVYFHCSNTRKVFVDRGGALVNDLVEAVITRPASCAVSLRRAASRIGATGSCTSAMTAAMSSLLSPSLLCPESLRITPTPRAFGS